MLSQPIATGETLTTEGGCVGGGKVGRGFDNSLSGGGGNVVIPEIGNTGSSMTIVSSVTGLGTEVGFTVDMAMHSICGSPVVP